MQVNVDIIKRFQVGDVDAFEELMRIEGPQMHSFIRHYIHSPEFAEDVFQEAWSRIWLSREQLQSTQKYRSWQYQIVRRAIYDQTRSKLWKMQSSIFSENETNYKLIDEKPDPRTVAERSLWRKILSDVSSSLDNQSQEILSLRFETAMGLQEISDTLNIPIGTVATKLRRSLVTLKAKLKSQGINSLVDI